MDEETACATIEQLIVEIEAILDPADLDRLTACPASEELSGLEILMDERLAGRDV